MPPTDPQTIGNPNATSDYSNTLNDRSADDSARQLISNIDSAANPQERAQIMLNNGISETELAQLRQVMSPFPQRTPEQGAAMAQQVEGPGGGQSADVGFWNDPITQAITAGTAGALGAGSHQVAAGLLTYPLYNDAYAGLANVVDKTIGTSHPNVAKIIKAALPAALVASGHLMTQMAPEVTPAAAQYAARKGAPPATNTVTAAAPATEAAPATPASAQQPVEALPPAQPTAGEPVTPTAAPPAAAASAGESAPAQAATPGEPVTPLNAGQLEHRIPVMVAHAQATPFTQEQVRNLGITAPDAEGHALLTTPIDAEDMLRLHFYTANQVNQAIQDAKLARDYGNEAASAEFQQLTKELNDVTLPRWRAGLHQAGLTLRILGDPASAESPTIRGFQGALDEHQAIANGISESGAPMDRMIRAMANLPTVEERAGMLERASAVDWTAPGAIRNLYINNLLSFNSAGKKLLSDAANIVWQVPNRALAEVGSRVGEAITGNDAMGVSPGETVAMIRGMNEHFGDALRVAAKSFIENTPSFESDVGFIDNPMPRSLLAGSGYEDTYVGRGIDFLGHLLSLPGRSIMAVDQFSKAMQYNMEMYTLASRQAYQEVQQLGLTGDEAAGQHALKMQQYIEKPTAAMQSTAMDVAKTNTFTADLEGSLAKLDAFRRSNFATRTLVPFFRTPINLYLQGIRQSPLAPLSANWRSTIAAGGPEAAIAASKTALGSLVLGYLASKVIEGKITGAAPSNLTPDMKEIWKQQNQEYSILLGTNPDGSKEWASYTNEEPLAWLLGATADMVPAIAQFDNNESGAAAYTLASAFAKQIDHQPMWVAVNNIAEAIKNTEGGKASQRFGAVLGRTAAGFLIPSTISNYGGEKDPIKRQTLGFLDALRQRNPWARDQLTPFTDDFGKPIIIPPGILANELPSFKTVTTEPDPVKAELLRLQQQVGFQVPAPPQSLGGPEDTQSAFAPPDKLYGTNLTPEEQNRWKAFRADPAPGKAPSLHDALEYMMSSEAYHGASEPMRANLVAKLWQQYGVIANSLLRSDPQVSLRLLDALQAKNQAFRATPQNQPLVPLAGGAAQ